MLINTIFWQCDWGHQYSNHTTFAPLLITLWGIQLTMSVCIKSKLYRLILTHWREVTHICVVRLTNIASDNGLSLGRSQAIIWTNYGTLLIWPLRTIFHELLTKIPICYLKKTPLKMSLGNLRPFCLCISVLIGAFHLWQTIVYVGSLRLLGVSAPGRNIGFFSSTVGMYVWYLGEYVYSFSFVYISSHILMIHLLITIVFLPLQIVF